MKFLRSIKRAFRLTALAGAVPFLLFPFFHYHPGYSHSHPGHETPHGHAGHYHSHEVETVAQFIDVHPSDPLGDGVNHSHNSREHQTDHDEFGVQKSQPPGFKPLFVHYSSAPGALIIPPSNSGYHVANAGISELSVLRFPDPLAVRAPPFA